MKRNIILFLLAGVLGLCAQAVLAADPGNKPETGRLIGAFIPRTGAWSEYALFDTPTGKRTVMRMAIVGEENDSYWYETLIKSGTSTQIVKMMITGDPNDPENIKRIIVKPGAKPARELAPDAVIEIGRKTAGMIEQQTGIPIPAEVNLEVVEIGRGSVTVPAGTFEVSLHQIMDADGKIYAEYKFADEVRPFGIVTVESASSTMVLVGHGTGAETQISEEPQKPGEYTTVPGDKSQKVEQDAMEPSGPETYPGQNLKQIPGMGSGYESRR